MLIAVDAMKEVPGTVTPVDEEEVGQRAPSMPAQNIGNDSSSTIINCLAKQLACNITA